MNATATSAADEIEALRDQGQRGKSSPVEVLIESQETGISGIYIYICGVRKK
jgi:hypothetical protein